MKPQNLTRFPCIIAGKDGVQSVDGASNNFRNLVINKSHNYADEQSYS